MNTKTTLLCALSSAFIFTACSPSYNMRVSLDEKTKVLNIDTLAFKNAREVYDRSSSKTHVYTTRKNYSSSDKRCERLYYFNKELKNHWYTTTNREDYLKELAIDKKEITCQVNKISNLKFITCEDNYTLKKKYDIVTSKNNEYGYGSVTHINSLNERCFNTIQNHFKEKAKKDDVKIEKYSFGENIK